jgi:hypothetical protein
MSFNFCASAKPCAGLRVPFDKLSKLVLREKKKKEKDFPKLLHVSIT